MTGRRPLSGFDADPEAFAGAVADLLEGAAEGRASLRRATATTDAEAEDATSVEVAFVVTGLGAEATGAALRIQESVLNHPDADEKPEPTDPPDDPGPSISGGDP